MKNKVDLIEDRLKSLTNILGDLDSNEVNRNTSTIRSNQKIKTVADIITILQKEIADNDSITYKEVYKKCIKTLTNSRAIIPSPGYREAKKRVTNVRKGNEPFNNVELRRAYGIRKATQCD
jgi:dihydroxyacetone kinase-like predicted kinase